MPKVKVNDIEIYYEVKGEGIPIILVSGYGGSSESWTVRMPEFIEDLSAHYQVLVFDNRGTGRSDKPDEKYTIQMMAEDLAGLMDTIQIPKAHVLGVSMGGLIAQELTISHPEKVLGLVLCCTFCNGQHACQSATDDFRHFVVSSANGIIPKMSREEFNETYLRWCFTPAYIKENKDRLVKALGAMNYPTPPVGIIRQAQAILEYDSCQHLSKIMAPTLLLGGEEDILVPHETIRGLAEKIPDAKLRIFKDSGHRFIKQIRDQVVPVILEFLSEIDIV